MTDGYRQEVLNVLLAQLLQERGVIAAPENIVRLGPEQKRRIPDVIVIFQGLRTAIEGEVNDQPDAHEKALESARQRVESGIAHIGVAVVYPAQLRQLDFGQLKAELASTTIEVAIVSEAGEEGFVAGHLDYLENALRRAFEQLTQEDVVARAVAIIDTAIDEFAARIVGQRGNVGRMAAVLDIHIEPESYAPSGAAQFAAAESGAVCRVGGLVLINAMIFQNILAEHNNRVTRPNIILEDELGGHMALEKHWDFIVERIDYFPIFHLASQTLKAMSRIPIRQMRNLAAAAQQIVALRAALRHDLMGRIYHRLLSDAKYLGTYYTGIPAAALLLKLALRPDTIPIQWHNLDAVHNLRIADPSCGTGTLLMAAADALTDNYVAASANQGRKVRLNKLQNVLAEEVLYGYDVLASAIHLTASTLALRTPEIRFAKMNLFSLPLGGEFLRLGSVEFLRGRTLQARDLFGAAPTTQQVAGRAMEEIDMPPLPDLDLCVMNPPFTRSVGGNLLFGSVPERERQRMQKRMQKLVAEPHIQANVTAGLGSVFVAIGDRYLKPGGRLALVLPKALLSGVAWSQTRDLINQRYRVEYVIASHDPDRWNFSESTDLSEVLLVATKVNGENDRQDDHRAVAVNLWRNPRNSFEALAIAHALAKHDPPDVTDGQGTLEIGTSKAKLAEAIRIPWPLFQANWLHPCAFAQADLVRAVYHLLRGDLWLPGYGDVAQVPLCPLGQLGTLGPDRRDIHDGFSLSKGPTAYPAFWGHDAEAMYTLAQQPNSHLAPLPKAKNGRPLRKVTDLWPKAGKVLIAERLWLETQRLTAVRLLQPVLSNVWWPFAVKKQPATDPGQIEKMLVLWLNSTLAMLLMLAHRVETRGAWIGFKKPILAALPVLDLRALSPEHIEALAAAYDRLAEEPLQPFPQMNDDAVRAEIDRAITAALNLPDFSILRTLLAREPVVCMKRL